MNTPNDAGDDTINQLWQGGPELPSEVPVDEEKIKKIFSDELKLAEATAKAMERINTLMRPKLNAETVVSGRVNEIDLRGREFSYDYQSAAPTNQAWSVIDLNTYDGASEGGESACIGRGATQKEALNDLLDQLGEYERPRPSRVIYSSGNREEPNEYADPPRDDVDFDDGLDDAR